MLTDKYKNFIQKTATKLISSYEKTTNKKYNPNDLNSIIDVIHFLNGDLIYVNDLYSKYKTDEVLLTQNENSFLIIIDKEYMGKQHVDVELNIKKTCFRMLWMYINEYLDKKGNIVSNEIIYPQNHFINSKKLLSFIEEDNKTKKLNLGK